MRHDRGSAPRIGSVPDSRKDAERSIVVGEVEQVVRLRESRRVVGRAGRDVRESGWDEKENEGGDETNELAEHL